MSDYTAAAKMLADRDALIARRTAERDRLSDLLDQSRARAMSAEREVERLRVALALTPETAGAELAALCEVARLAQRYIDEPVTSEHLRHALAKWRATREGR